MSRTETELHTLFDEFGTPTFRLDRESDFFAGVAATYRACDEQSIHRQCEDLMGLTRSAEVKNNKLSARRAQALAELVPTLPMQITVCSVDLSSSRLQCATERHEAFGAIARKHYRGEKSRPVAQILHTELMDYVLGSAMHNVAAGLGGLCHFSLSIDHWDFPVPDRCIEIDGRRRADQVNACLQAAGYHGRVHVDPLVLLGEESPRARFIGTLTSAISRAYFRQDSRKYLADLDTVATSNARYGSSVEDITQRAIEWLTRDVLELPIPDDCPSGIRA